MAIGLVVLTVAVASHELGPPFFRGMAPNLFIPHNIGSKPPSVTVPGKPGAPTGAPTGTGTKPGGSGRAGRQSNGGPVAGGVLLSAYTSGANPSSVIAKLNASPVRVSIVSWVFAWDGIEPLNNHYNWSRIDAALAAARASGRKSYLRVVAGIHSPAWIYAAGVPALSVPSSCSPGGPIQYGTIRMPATWSAAYIAIWTAFLRALGARYNGASGLFAVSIGGGGMLGEMTLPHNCLPLLQQYGYTDSGLIAAWKSFESTGRAAFPSNLTTLAIEEPLGFGNSNVLPSLMSYARSRFGSRLLIQQNGLRLLTRSGPYFPLLLGASAYTSVGWQMWGGNNTATSLHTSFQTAIMSHASYVEVYLNDITNPANATSLRYLTAGKV